MTTLVVSCIHALAHYISQALHLVLCALFSQWKLVKTSLIWSSCDLKVREWAFDQKVCISLPGNWRVTELFHLLSVGLCVSMKRPVRPRLTLLSKTGKKKEKKISEDLYCQSNCLNPPAFLRLLLLTTHFKQKSLLCFLKRSFWTTVYCRL